MEADMRLIAEGVKTRQIIYDESISEIKKIFTKIADQAGQFRQSFNDKIVQNGGQIYNHSEAQTEASSDNNGGYGGSRPPENSTFMKCP